MAGNVRLAADGASACFSEELSDLSAQFVLDMRANDIVERRLHFEAERDRAARIKPARPAGDDPFDQFVRGAPDAGGDFVAGDAPQGRDLLADRAAYARHSEIDAVTQL